MLTNNEGPQWKKIERHKNITTNCRHIAAGYRPNLLRYAHRQHHNCGSKSNEPEQAAHELWRTKLLLNVVSITWE